VGSKKLSIPWFRDRFHLCSIQPSRVKEDTQANSQEFIIKRGSVCACVRDRARKRERERERESEYTFMRLNVPLLYVVEPSDIFT
jgi:hypothetical protein